MIFWWEIINITRQVGELYFISLKTSQHLIANSLISYDGLLKAQELKL